MIFLGRVRQPSLWVKGVWGSEIAAAVICGPLVHANTGLDLGQYWEVLQAQSNKEIEIERELLTPGGTNFPSISAPSEPVIRGRVDGTGG